MSWGGYTRLLPDSLTGRSPVRQASGPGDAGGSGPGDAGGAGPEEASWDDEVDIVQFTCPLYFGETSEGELSIDIMRLGKLHGAVSVRYHTENGSAVAGQQYQHAEGVVTIPDGESGATITVSIIPDPIWNPTLEFKVHVHDPEGCELGAHLKAARVKVINDRCFPSDKFEKEVGEGEDSIQNINNMLLFKSFLWLMFQRKGMTWRTIVILVFDEMRNLYLLLTLTLSIYVVDTVFNFKDESTLGELLLPDQRVGTAIIVGLLIVVPMVILHIWDIVKIKIDAVGLARQLLQTSLFRKYLNYSEESRQAVPPEDLLISIMQDSADVADGYIATLGMVQLGFKVAVMMYFTLSENPDVWWVLFLMPGMMLVYGALRMPILMRVSAESGAFESKLTGFVQDVIANYPLVADYFQRPQMNDLLLEKSEVLRRAKVPERCVTKNNQYFPKWLGTGFVGVYTALAASSVVDGSLSLGTFLATTSVFREISSDFGEVFELVMQVCAVCDPLKGLTVLFNMQTDLPTWKALNRRRRAATKADREAALSLISQRAAGEHWVPASDMIPLKIDSMCFGYRSKKLLYEDMSFSVPQGQLVAIMGPQGTGRRTFMSLLGHRIFPTSGRVMFPTHLRILYVSQSVYILKMSIWRNLLFGCGDRDVDPERVEKILTKLRMPVTLELCRGDIERCKASRALRGGDGAAGPGDEEAPADYDADCDAAEGAAEGGDGPRVKPLEMLSSTERAKLHLARALIMNAELMILQRPLAHHDDPQQQDLILSLIEEHVGGRGLCMPPGPVHRRRPRTVFFTPEHVEQAERADSIFLLEPESRSMVSRAGVTCRTRSFHTA